MMTDTGKVTVEFYGGPADGMTLTIAADATVYLMSAPQMTPAEFIALEQGRPAPPGGIEHRYVRSVYFGKTSGKRLFLYRGPVRRKTTDGR